VVPLPHILWPADSVTKSDGLEDNDTGCQGAHSDNECESVHVHWYIVGKKISRLQPLLYFAGVGV
jgi:hypothetical protein